MQLSERARQRWLFSGAVIAALVTFAVFRSCFGNEFVDLDDLGYLPIGSAQERGAVTTLIWAFTEFPGANWHPLTMLSLAADARLWGDNPFGYHLNNVLIHCGSVFLSCLLFSGLIEAALQQHKGDGRYCTQAAGSGLIVVASLAGALLFGLHPLRVESVVWASERKDVLCLLFLISALIFHLRYRRLGSGTAEAPLRRIQSYGMLLLSGGLAMLSKPLAVSLPLILLIIDWYPLGRFTNARALRRALIEKIPLFVMAGVCAVMTMIAQQIAILRAPQVDAASRLLVACKALLFYLWKTLWPTDLSALYPHPGNVATAAFGEYLVYAAAAAVITGVAVAAGRRSRLWPALWLYYVLSLAPMLGLVQVGAQWAADRYSYLPALGISLVLGFGAARLFFRLLQQGPGRLAVTVACLTIVAIMALTELTHRQIEVWRTTETLTTRIIEQIPYHPESPYYTRAKYRNETGAYAGALQDLEMSLSIARRYHQERKFPELHIAKAHVLSNLGRLPEALEQADLALELSPGEPPAAYRAFRDHLAGQIMGEHAQPQGFQ
jgi:tetratricopeptide (TPR) repeat protein